VHDEDLILISKLEDSKSRVRIACHHRNYRKFKDIEAQSTLFRLTTKIWILPDETDCGISDHAQKLG
jgi:hypothetical protein